MLSTVQQHVSWPIWRSNKPTKSFILCAISCLYWSHIAVTQHLPSNILSQSCHQLICQCKHWVGCPVKSGHPSLSAEGMGGHWPATNCKHFQLSPGCMPVCLSLTCLSVCHLLVTCLPACHLRCLTCCHLPVPVTLSSSLTRPFDSRSCSTPVSTLSLDKPPSKSAPPNL